VPVSPGGVVADYVPFYFAARSPMLYAITMGNVPSYQGGQGELVYLVTSVSVLGELGLQFVFTDRNAALALAHFSNDLDELNDHVDWGLMDARMWNNTVEHPDRLERRMAEMLVHRHVPWAAFEMVAVRTEQQKQRVSTILANVGANTGMRVEPDWYF